MTDGFTYGAIFPPTFPCSGALLPFVAGPFPVPIVPGLFAAPINDIDFDGATGSLIGCDGTGVVASFLPAPFPAPGPFPTFFAPPTLLVAAAALIALAPLCLLGCCWTCPGCGFCPLSILARRLPFLPPALL